MRTSLPAHPAHPAHPGRHDASIATSWRSRWPIPLALIFAILMLDLVENASVASAVLVGMAVIYAISAVLGIRRAAWPSFGVVFVIIGLDQVFDVDPTLWLPLLLAPALVWRALRPVARRTPAAAALWALVIFAGLVIAGLGAPDEVRGYVVAVAFIGHGVWDVVHWLRGTLVVRSLAEFCAVLDLTLGVAMLVVL